MLEFAKVLPAIRARVSSDMAKRGLPREKVVATVVNLLETTLIRVGNKDYAKDNGSYGLTTLRSRHVAVASSELRFNFKGKSGKTWRLQVKDRRVARVVKACQELPGQHLFQYIDADSESRAVTSSDVNDYLREITGTDITAKTSVPGQELCWRRWHSRNLRASTPRCAKMNVKRAIEQVAARLGNTPTICRKCYVHPEVPNSYLDGQLLENIKSEVETVLRDKIAGLKPEEAAVLGLMRKRLGLEIDERTRADLEVVPAAAHSTPALVLTHVSPDGDQGFPGDLSVQATYRLDGDREWLKKRN
jgi:DNA topoisomerase-1